MQHPAVILDCDPGHDDAIAIIAAARYCELIAITTVNGNVDLEKTTRNALIACQIAGIDVPVHAGASRPLVAEPHHAQFIHGESGLDGPKHPPLRRQVDGDDAVRFIIDTVRERNDVWLVAVGPLTNVALALRSAPDIASRLQGISIMGGGIAFGNATPAAEFNIFADPEAAAIVFDAPVRRIVAPLDLTHQLLIDDPAIDRFRATATAAGRFAADLLDFYGDAYARAFSGRKEGPLHDPCAVLALSHPHLFEREKLFITVETRGEHTRGMTLADRRGVRSDLEPNTEVLNRIDAPAALDLLVESMSAYNGPSR